MDGFSARGIRDRDEDVGRLGERVPDLLERRGLEGRARAEPRQEHEEAALAVGFAPERRAQIGIDLGEDRLAHLPRLLVPAHRPVVGEQPAPVPERVGVVLRHGPDRGVADVREDDRRPGRGGGVNERLVGVGREEAAAEDREPLLVPADAPCHADAGATGTAARSPRSRAARRGRSRDGRAGRTGDTSASRNVAAGRLGFHETRGRRRGQARRPLSPWRTAAATRCASRRGSGTASAIGQPRERPADLLRRRPGDLERERPLPTDRAGGPEEREPAFGAGEGADGALHRGEVREAPHHRDARPSHPRGERREIDEVEATKGEPVEEDEVELGQELAADEERGERVRRVPAVLAEPPPDEPLEARPGADDARDPDVTPAASDERRVVEADGAERPARRGDHSPTSSGSPSGAGAAPREVEELDAGEPPAHGQDRRGAGEREAAGPGAAGVHEERPRDERGARTVGVAVHDDLRPAAREEGARRGLRPLARAEVVDDEGGQGAERHERRLGEPGERGPLVVVPADRGDRREALERGEDGLRHDVAGVEDEVAAGEQRGEERVEAAVRVRDQPDSHHVTCSPRRRRGAPRARPARASRP